MSFVQELKRRNVFRVGIAYVVASWIVLQATDVIGEILELPPWGGKLILTLLCVGFFIALFFAWAFELTPEGVKREKDVDRSQSITQRTGRKLDFIIIALLAAGLVYFVYESRFMDRAPGGGDSTERVDSVTDVVTAEDMPGTGTTPAIDARAIAVLPFANRSLREEDGFFTDGIHDDLLTQLAKIGDLKVISRTSMLQYRDTQKPIPEIARELRVGTILEGGVQRAGDRVRINAQLIDVVHDQHLWAETFDREMTVENIFDIQSEITRQIVQAVRGELSESEQATLTQVPTDDLEAYEAYLRAGDLLSQPNYVVDNYIQAETWALRAVERDPEFAQAWAQLVEVHGQAIWLGIDSAPERFEAARQALDNALRYGPGLPETLAAQAEYQYRVEQDFRRAAASYWQAHEAAPGNAEVLYRVGVARRRTPDLAGAIQAFEQALDLDPNNARVATTLVETLVTMEQLDRAERLAGEWALRDPDLLDIRGYQVEIQLRRGDTDSARGNFENLTPSNATSYFFTAHQLLFMEREYEALLDFADSPLTKHYVEARGGVGLDHLFKAWAYHLTGQEETAVAEARAGIAAIQSLPPLEINTYAFELATLGELMALAGDREGALAAAAHAARLLPVDNDQLFGSHVAFQNIRTLALAGEREQALSELQRNVEAPYPVPRAILRLDPRWDFLRDDERFNALAQADASPEAGP